MVRSNSGQHPAMHPAMSTCSTIGGCSDDIRPTKVSEIFVRRSQSIKGGRLLIVSGQSHIQQSTVNRKVQLHACLASFHSVETSMCGIRSTTLRLIGVEAAPRDDQREETAVCSSGKLVTNYVCMSGWRPPFAASQPQAFEGGRSQPADQMVRLLIRRQRCSRENHSPADI